MPVTRGSGRRPTTGFALYRQATSGLPAALGSHGMFGRAGPTILSFMEDMGSLGRCPRRARAGYGPTGVKGTGSAYPQAKGMLMRSFARNLRSRSAPRSPRIGTLAVGMDRPAVGN